MAPSRTATATIKIWFCGKQGWVWHWESMVELAGGRDDRDVGHGRPEQIQEWGDHWWRQKETWINSLEVTNKYTLETLIDTRAALRNQIPHLLDKIIWHQVERRTRLLTGSWLPQYTAGVGSALTSQETMHSTPQHPWKHIYFVNVSCVKTEAYCAAFIFLVRDVYDAQHLIQQREVFNSSVCISPSPPLPPLFRSFRRTPAEMWSLQLSYKSGVQLDAPSPQFGLPFMLHEVKQSCCFWALQKLESLTSMYCVCVNDSSCFFYTVESTHETDSRISEIQLGQTFLTWANICRKQHTCRMYV